MKIGNKFFLCLFASFLFVPVPPVFAYEVGDTVTCVRLPEVFHPTRDAQEVVGCLEGQESSEQSFTMLEFFTVNCGYCTQNLPAFAQLAQDISETTTSRFVSLTKERSQLNSYIERHSEHMVAPVMQDERREASRYYDVRAVPTLYVINKNQKVVFKKLGMLKEQDIEQIRNLVQVVAEIE